MQTKFNVTFDEKRCGYWINGHGFDFFAYFTGDGGPQSWIECDCVTREGANFKLPLAIPIETAKTPSCDLVETLVARELHKSLELFQ